MNERLDLDPEQVRAIEFCVYCPRLCHFACPSAYGEASETATAWGLMSLADMIRRGKIQPGAEDARNLYRCASCGRCTDFCRHDNDVAGVLADVRGRLVIDGLEPTEITALRSSYLHHSAPEEPGPGAREAADRPRRRAGFAYFPGCPQLGADMERLDATRKLIELVAGAHVDFAWNAESFCCGAIARRAGLNAEADRARVRLRAAVAGYHTVITGCVDAEVGEDGPRIVPLSEFLATRADVVEALARAAGRTSKDTQITLHGGCRERRQLDLRESEHALLAAVGFDVTDAHALEGKQECCGAERVFRTVSPAAATRAAAAVVRGSRKVGAEGETGDLATSSCRCSGFMTDASGETVKSVIDLILERCTTPA